jgi:hypothetical protein
MMRHLLFAKEHDASRRARLMSHRKAPAPLQSAQREAGASGDEMLVRGAAKEVSAGAADHRCCRILTAVRQSRIGGRRFWVFVVQRDSCRHGRAARSQCLAKQSHQVDDGLWPLVGYSAGYGPTSRPRCAVPLSRSAARWASIPLLRARQRVPRNRTQAVGRRLVGAVWGLDGPTLPGGG